MGSEEEKDPFKEYIPVALFVSSLFVINYLFAIYIEAGSRDLRWWEIFLWNK